MTPPSLRTRDDGSVWLEDRMPDVIEVSYIFLESEPRFVERRGDILDFTAANGRWVFEIVGSDDARQVHTCEIRYREEKR